MTQNLGRHSKKVWAAKGAWPKNMGHDPNFGSPQKQICGGFFHHQDTSLYMLLLLKLVKSLILDSTSFSCILRFS